MSESRTFGWKRAWQPPRSVYKGATLKDLTPRGEWLYKRSKLRAMDNPDIVIAISMTGEIGSWSNFKFITKL